MGNKYQKGEFFFFFFPEHFSPFFSSLCIIGQGADLFQMQSENLWGRRKQKKRGSSSPSLYFSFHIAALYTRVLFRCLWCINIQRLCHRGGTGHCSTPAPSLVLAFSLDHEFHKPQKSPALLWTHLYKFCTEKWKLFCFTTTESLPFQILQD